MQGAVNPDEFYVYKRNLAAGRPAILRKTRRRQGACKMVFADERVGRAARRTTVDVAEAERRRFSITDAEAEELARYAIAIEKHYGRPMDIEWGRDGDDGKLYILQARPETVKSREERAASAAPLSPEGARPTCSRPAARSARRSGRARCASSSRPPRWTACEAGDVLVTDMTDPDWEPVMKRAAAIVTNRGGRTCHAAIIARELGIPGRRRLRRRDAGARARAPRSPCRAPRATPATSTRACSTIEIVDVALDRMPPSPTKIMMNVGNPELAFEFQRLPNEGVGLARLEFIINRNVGIHPQGAARVRPAAGRRSSARSRRASRPIASPTEFYVAARSPRAWRRSPRRSGRRR